MKGTRSMSRMSTRLPKRAAAAALSAAARRDAAMAGDGSAVAAPAAKSPHAKSAGSWLESQVTRGRIHNGQFDFDDWGLTIDTAFALAAAGGHGKTIRNMTAAIRAHYYKGYATYNGDKIAGAMAKSLVACGGAGQEPAQVRRAATCAPRCSPWWRPDPRASRPAGCATPARPTSATRSLRRTPSSASPAAALGRAPCRYLLKQQCSGGLLPALTEVAGETCDQSGSAADVDATALAIQALLRARATALAIPAGVVHRAVALARRRTAKNGSFPGRRQHAGPNSNSTGLAAQALHLVPGHSGRGPQGRGLHRQPAAHPQAGAGSGGPRRRRDRVQPRGAQERPEERHPEGRARPVPARERAGDLRVRPEAAHHAASAVTAW